MPSNPSRTIEHLKRLPAFRQAVYDQMLTKRRDAQQELLEALLLSPPVHSFPELSLAFRRAGPSLYKGLAEGQQDETAQLERIARQIPTKLVMVFPLDESAVPRPDAHPLEDRGRVHSATPAIDGAGIVIGHSYSMLAYCAAPQTSLALPVSTRRVPTRRVPTTNRVSTTNDAVTIGAAQVRALCRACADKPALKVVVGDGRGDGRYGDHRFLGALRSETEAGACALLVRLRSDRVLYGAPGPYGGRGRPRKQGDVFRFKDEARWPAPQEHVFFPDTRYGQVELQLGEGLHAREDAERVFSVLRAAIHLERKHPPKPLGLAWVGPALPVEEIGGFYLERSTLIWSAARWKRASAFVNSTWPGRCRIFSRSRPPSAGRVW